jgi:hypothetical protein
VKRRGTLAISWGKWGGFYVHRPKGRFVSRVCLGFVAITYLPLEIDELMEAYADQRERRILETPGVAEGIEQTDRVIEAWRLGLEESGAEDEQLAEADMAAGFEALMLGEEPCGEPGCCRLAGHHGPACARRRAPRA